jgi:hypothetical protein
MNIAELINAKIKSQNVADAVAISAATWEARALNLIAQTNRMMLEYWNWLFVLLASGAVVSIFCLFVCSLIPDPNACWLCFIAGGGVDIFLLLNCLDALRFIGQFQDAIIDLFDQQIVTGNDLNTVANLNYYYKPNTAEDTVGALAYVYQGGNGDILLDPPPGDGGVLERAGICEIMVADMYLTYKLGYMTQQEWQNNLARIVPSYQRGQSCFNGALDRLLPSTYDVFKPYMLKTKNSFRTAQDFEQFLPLTIGVYKERKPPVVLGKGNTADDCVPGEEDTKFPCPALRRYAFSSSHAFSESVWHFYNEDTDPTSTPYPIPLIPWDMDWEARLFAIEPNPFRPAPFGGIRAYNEIINQVEPLFGSEEADDLRNNTLRVLNRPFFLY